LFVTPAVPTNLPAKTTVTKEGTAPAGPWNRMLPNTTDWFGRFRLAANATNDYMTDREKQRHVIIRVRRRLLMAARALAEQGVTPPGLDDPDVFGAPAGGVFLPQDADWLEATEDLRRGFVKHPELDPTITGPLV
jgi:hypothetical protein